MPKNQLREKTNVDTTVQLCNVLNNDVAKRTETPGGVPSFQNSMSRFHWNFQKSFAHEDFEEDHHGDL